MAITLIVPLHTASERLQRDIIIAKDMDKIAIGSARALQLTQLADPAVNSLSKPEFGTKDDSSLTDCEDFKHIQPHQNKPLWRYSSITDSRRHTKEGAKHGSKHAIKQPGKLTKCPRFL